MKLYHGSNMAVRHPLILPSDRKLDFGTGFYLTSDLQQAKKWASLTARRRGKGEPTVTIYECREDAMEQLRLLRFPKADREWLRFVSANRRNKDTPLDCDIVIGPVANDRTMPVINLYFAGAYTEEEAIQRLLPQKLKDQYAFRTERALKLLQVIEVLTNE